MRRVRSLLRATALPLLLPTSTLLPPTGGCREVGARAGDSGMLSADETGAGRAPLLLLLSVGMAERFRE